MSLPQEERLEKMLKEAEQCIENGKVSKERHFFKRAEKILENVKRPTKSSIHYDSVVNFLIQESLRVILDRADECFYGNSLQEGRRYAEEARGYSAVYNRKFSQTNASLIFESLIRERINDITSEFYTHYLSKNSGKFHRAKTTIMRIIKG